MSLRRGLYVVVTVLLLFILDLTVIAPEVVQGQLTRAPAGEPAWWTSHLTLAWQMLRPSTPFAAEAARFFWFLHLLVGGAVVYVVQHLLGSRLRPRDASSYASHGSARWASEAELRKHLRPSGPGLILGKSRNRPLIHPPDPKLPHNQLVAVFGGSGSRKTRSFVMPNLLHAKDEDILVMDPKGENYARTAAVLEARGYEVKVLNFLRMATSDRWNPLAYVDSVNGALDLAAAVIHNTANPNRPAKADPFWDDAEKSLLTAVLLYVLRHRPPSERHMASVLELATDPHPADLDLLFEGLHKTDPARRFYRGFLRADEKVRSGIIAGVSARLQLWNSDALAELTAGNDIDLRRLGTGEKPTVLYLIVPDSKPTYAPVLAVFWQHVFQILYEVADDHGGSLPRRVRCRMDEFCNCGYIPEIEKKLSTMRSRNVSVEMVMQTLDQLRNRYPHTWSELLGNCDTWLFLGGNDLETAKYIAEKLGHTTVQIHGHGSTVSNRTSTGSQNLNYTGRPLLTPDECLRLPADDALLLRRGCHPARIQKLDFSEHPAFREITERKPSEYTGGEREPLAVLDTDKLFADRRTAAPNPQKPAEAGFAGADSDAAGAGTATKETGEATGNGEQTDPLAATAGADSG